MLVAAVPAPNRFVKVGEILPRAETPYAAVAEAVADRDVIAVVHGPERTCLGPSTPPSDAAAAAAVEAAVEVTVGDAEDDEQPDFELAAAGAALVELLPRFPQFTCPTLAQRLLPPMPLATPTSLPLLRPYVEGDPEDADGLLPFETTRAEPDGTGAVRQDPEEAEEDGHGEELLEWCQSRGCDVVFPW